MDAPTPLLRVRNLSKRFGGVRALAELDWDVRHGEAHCLVGENGCGKSTLIKLIAGVHQPDRGGSIEIDGVTQPVLTPASAKALGVQVIFQDLSLFPNLTVAENIGIDLVLGRYAAGARHRSMRRAASTQLERLGFELALDRTVGSLPIAERQIVAICRGLAAQARLLFMDEPTASLTRSEVDRLLAVVQRLQSERIAVVFVSHRLDEVARVAERVTVLRDGRKVGTYPAAEVDPRRIGQLMTGAVFDHARSPRQPVQGPLRLEVEGLTRPGSFADITFGIRAGEVLGLTGLLGAGRTELALALFGMEPATRGTVRVDGKQVPLDSNRAAIDAGIAYVSEDRLNLGLNMRQSIADNLTLPILPRLAGRLGLVSPGKRGRLAADWIERLRIKAGSASLPVNTLSGGNQQRVVLAKWLATEPLVLILDSPTVGVDIGNKAGIYEIIAGLAREGVAILVISDEVAELYATCDRILHMRQGRLVSEADPATAPQAQFEAELYA